MPKAAPKTPVTAEERRRTLLVNAARLFVEKGFASTSVDEIGESLGITGPALYRYFPNKQAILDAACIEAAERLLAAVQTALETANGTAQSRLLHLVEARVDFAMADAFSMLLHHHEEGNMSEEARERIAAVDEFYIAEWMRVLTQARPDVPATDLFTAVIAAHMLIGYTLARFRNHRPASLRDQMIRMAMATLEA